MTIRSDIHVHTSLSFCAKPEATPENYIARCEAEGIQTLGFANHYWDDSIPLPSETAGASGFYRGQNTEHVMSLRNMIPEDTHGVKILFGCETEYSGIIPADGKRRGVAIKPETAKKFDYVLIPLSHFHMPDFTVPQGLEGADRVRSLLLEYFMTAVGETSLGVPTLIAHPFDALGFGPVNEEILAGISDAEFYECFKLAKSNNIGLEMNAAVLPRRSYQQDEAGQSVVYTRMYTIAKECGCFFSVGSDSHHPDSFKRHAEYGVFAEHCGIKEEDLLFNS